MQSSTATPRVTIRQPEGKLGVLTPGLGAVATTFMAGVESIRRGLTRTDRVTDPDGDDPPRQADGAAVAAHQGFRAARPSSMTSCSARGIPFPDDAYTAAKKAGVLEDRHLESVADFLRGIKPMPAVFDSRYVTRLKGRKRQAGQDQARPRRAAPPGHPRLSRRATGAIDSLWSGARRRRRTSRPGPQHATIEQFERAMERNDDAIAPSMLYAWASIMEGVPVRERRAEPARSIRRRSSSSPTSAVCPSRARISRPARRG